MNTATEGSTSKLGATTHGAKCATTSGARRAAHLRNDVDGSLCQWNNTGGHKTDGHSGVELSAVVVLGGVDHDHDAEAECKADDRLLRTHTGSDASSPRFGQGAAQVRTEQRADSLHSEHRS